MTARLPTVVVVDDAEDLRALVKTYLRLSRRFHVVGEGTNGVEAIELVALHHPDLLLLDVSMPQMDGLEALPRVREASPHTQVVMFTGFDQRGLAERAVLLGAAALLEKSISLRNLAGDLVRILETTTGEPVPEPPIPETAPPPRGEHDILAEHLERFREVFDEAAIGLGTMTLRGRLVRANRAMAELVGRTDSELVGLAYADLMVGGRPEQFDAVIDAVTAGGQDTARLEHDVATSSGDRTVLTTLAPVRDANGHPLYLFVQAQNVTEQRLAEEALRQSEDRFRLLVAAVGDYAIFMLDPTGHIESWNIGAQRLKGYTAEEIIGQHFRVFYPPDKQASQHPEHELEVALREGHYEEEGWRIRKDGTRFWANVVITAVHDNSGRHVGFAKVTRDFTERRYADEALRQSEERFRLLVAAVGDYAIFMLDPTGHIESWNIGAQRLKGYTAEEIIGQHFRVFYPPEKQASQHPEHELKVALCEGHYEEEGWRIRKDGTRFWANVVITAVHDNSGRHVGFAKVTRDVTERREMAERQMAAAQALEQANHDLGLANELLATAADERAQFLAVTAHELRTPIGILGGFAELMRQHWSELDEAERGEMLESMTANTARLRRLLDDLLTAARLDANAVELSDEDVSITALLSDAVNSARAQHEDQELTLDIPDDLHVRGDPVRISQAVDNLIANALRHGQAPVEVSARRSGARVEIRIADHGSGVPPDLVPRLFGRFATGARHGGTGLGLFIVRQLAVAHNGDTWYEPGSAGTLPTFVFAIPA